jgi:hypothetical protein
VVAARNSNTLACKSERLKHFRHTLAMLFDHVGSLDPDSKLKVGKMRTEIYSSALSTTNPSKSSGNPTRGVN